MDEDRARVTIKPDNGSDNISIRFLYKTDEAYKRVSVNHAVTIPKSKGWSILIGPNYRIATYEMRANSLETACLNAPDGFIRARLVPICKDSVPDEYEMECPQTQTPVGLLGLELSNETDSVHGGHFNKIELGEWTGVFGVAAALKAGSTPICERRGVYATIILVGPK